MAERSGELNDTEKDIDNFEFEEKTEVAAADDSETKAVAEISDDPEELRGQIEETRRGMSEKLDAIQEKLSFSNISEQVKDQVSEQITGAVETLKTSVSDATIGKAEKIMSSLGKEIKKMNIPKIAGENPMPLILIGLGLGLLAIRKYRGDSSDYKKFRYKGNSTDAQSKAAAGKSASQSGGVTGAIGDSASAAFEGVSGAASSTYGAVSGAAGGAYDKAGDLGGKLKKQYSTQVQKNPLVVGAIALAAGAAVGLSLPSTSYEGKLMGETRENLMSQAGDAARGAYEKVQDVVAQAKDTIAEDIGQVVAQAKDTLTEVVKTAGAGDSSAKPVGKTDETRA